MNDNTSRKHQIRGAGQSAVSVCSKEIPSQREDADADQIAVGALDAFLGTLVGMGQVEELISQKLESEAALLTEISGYLLDLGGKRIRPALALTVSELFGSPDPSPELIDLAAGLELIHMATLLHDDIIDKAELRRNQTAPHKRYGEGPALLTGDFLLVRAFSLCARLDQFIITETEQACVALTEGEILETPLHCRVSDLDLALTIARKKTAALFTLAAVGGAHLSGASPAEIALMRTFGEAMGVAFQILDDLLDIASEREHLGKTIGGDIVERKPSVVNVLWLQSGSPLAQRLLAPPGSSDEEQSFVEGAIRELRDSALLSEVRELARGFIGRADQALQQAADGRAKTPFSDAAFTRLRALLSFTTTRIG